MKYKWLLLLILITLSTYIIYENRTMMVDASFMSYHLNIHLGMMLLVGLALGVITGMLLGITGTKTHGQQGHNSSNNASNIYVGNLADNTSESDLENTFSTYGAVKSVNIIKDRETGLPRGFGFIEMDSYTEGDAAIAALNETVLLGQTINVNRARAKRQHHRRRPQQRNQNS